MPLLIEKSQWVKALSKFLQLALMPTARIFMMATSEGSISYHERMRPKEAIQQ
jgi:hypothetical protein